jgi:hypothetical protein
MANYLTVRLLIITGLILLMLTACNESDRYKDSHMHTEYHSTGNFMTFELKLKVPHLDYSFLLEHNKEEGNLSWEAQFIIKDLIKTRTKFSVCQFFYFYLTVDQLFRMYAKLLFLP